MYFIANAYFHFFPEFSVAWLYPVTRYKIIIIILKSGWFSCFKLQCHESTVSGRCAVPGCPFVQTLLKGALPPEVAELWHNSSSTKASHIQIKMAPELSHEFYPTGL